MAGRSSYATRRASLGSRNDDGVTIMWWRHGRQHTLTLEPGTDATALHTTLSTIARTARREQDDDTVQLLVPDHRWWCSGCGELTNVDDTDACSNCKDGLRVQR